MSGKFLAVEEILAILSGTPQRIETFTADLTPLRLKTPSSEGEWSVSEVLAHLRACSDVWGGHILRMLAEEHPTIRGVNPRTWMKKTDYLEQDFHPSLQAFIQKRNDLLAVLAALTPKDWMRAATVTVGSLSNQRTVLSYADDLARHERAHVRQMGRMVERMRHLPQGD